MLEARQNPSAGREESSSLRRLGVILRPHTVLLALTVVLQLALAGVNMIVPAFIKLLIDDVFPPPGNWSLLWLILAGILVVYAARNALYFYTKSIAVKVGEDVAFEMRNRLFDHLQRMSLQFYRRHKAGNVSNRVMGDSLVIQNFMQDELPTLLQAVFRFLCLVAIVYAINWQLALASTILLPLHLMVFHWFKRPIKQAGRVAQEHMDVVHGRLIEKFLAMEVVKGFTGEERESKSFQETIDLSRQSEARSKTFHVTQKVVADMIVGLGTIALLGFGAYQVLRTDGHAMLPGTFMAFFSFVLMLYPTVLELMSGFAKLAKTTASIDRMFEVLQAAVPERCSVSVPLLPAIKGHVEYDSVCFRYEDGPPVLRNVNLRLGAGQVMAVVGPSGAGKSTLVSLLPRFNDPNMGTVYLDGIDVRKFDVRHLRKAIGIAFQECFLFNSSIYENLRYARPDATMRQIVEVAKRTGAHDFIMKMPQGYATVIGQDGVTLSRGENQRLNLTRAMLKNPQVLILDEATVSIDIQSEATVIPAILDFMRGKTTVMITHRPELLRHADVVVQVVEGRITYQGPPTGLPGLTQEPTTMTHPATTTPPPSQSPPSPVEAPVESPRVRVGEVFGRIGLILLALTVGMGVTGWPGSARALTDEATIVEASATPPAPPGGRFEPLPGVTVEETEELLHVVASRAMTELGYASASPDLLQRVASPLPNLEAPVILGRSEGANTLVLVFGYRRFTSQPVHVLLWGQVMSGEQPATANPDVDRLAVFLGDALQSRQQQQQTVVAVTELVADRIKLSYVDPARCVQMLKVFGYTVIEPGQPVDPSALPVIVPMPATAEHKLVPDKGNTGQNFPLTDGDPISELLVFYHPSRPEQFAQVNAKVRHVIDVPARQIMIEAMVLEISETGLKKLGVQWELQSPWDDLRRMRLGRLPTFTADESSTFSLTARNVFGDFRARIQALVRDGTAQVLSRPSVLTLDNRMAYINIAERIPVLTSVQSPNAASFTVNWSEKIAGITLSVRPRVSDDGQQVSMQVGAAVTARVPNADVVATNSDGDEVARSPTISEREVRTFTRIANNTPFIIGGLVSRDETSDYDKVPILGDLPLVGAAFRNEATRKLKREVIIVITPFVLPEHGLVGRNLPKDDDMFDSFDNRLFRDAYRIRAEDVFDLTFLLENRQLLRAQRLVAQVAARDYQLAQRWPFNRFSDGALPGERILVYRQMYEVIKRRRIDQNVDPARMIFFQPDEQSQTGFKVASLPGYLGEQVGVRSAPNRAPDLARLFSALGKQALVLTYTLRRYDLDPQEIFQQPVPAVSLVDCPDKTTWSRLLWDLNQATPEGDQRRTIILHSPDDLVRLQRAIVLKRAVEINAGRTILNLRNFSIGRLMLIPEIKDQQSLLIDDETAKYFFYTEHYYPVVKFELARDIEALRGQFQNPDIRAMIADPDTDLRLFEAQQ